MAWVFEQEDRLVSDSTLTLNPDGGPEVPQLMRQVVLPNVRIDSLDNKYGVSSITYYNILRILYILQLGEKLDALAKHWEDDKQAVRRELALFPPKSQLEEDVFQVKVPDYKLLY